jgi:hypothetical protein
MRRISVRLPLREGLGEGAGRSRAKAFHSVIALAVVALVAGTSHARSQQSTGVPQAFLLGAWSGGLFPAPSQLSPAQCLAQPTVIFTRDLVMRATLTDAFYIQRLIETARGTGTGVDFEFSSAAAPAAAPGLPGFTGGGEVGFGCESANELHVQRITPNEIRFPGCRDFPFPLVRCPGG